MNGGSPPSGGNGAQGWWSAIVSQRWGHLETRWWYGDSRRVPENGKEQKHASMKVGTLMSSGHGRCQKPADQALHMRRSYSDGPNLSIRCL